MSFPAPVQPYHSKPYEAINPTKPDVSTKGKNILITGGGAGIGKATAVAFAQSGAANIGIIGRRPAVLEATKAEIEAAYPETEVFALPGDLADTASITAAVQGFADAISGAKIDVLVAAAGYLHDLKPLEQTDARDFWYTYEANVRGAFDLLRAFGPLAAADAVVVNVSTGAAHFPYLPNNMSYSSSKLAAIKVFDYFAYERPGVRLVHLQPGVIETDMGKKASAAGAAFPFDDINLPAHFTVWLTSAEAAFLDKRFIWANWDVDALKAKKDEILVRPQLFTPYLLGFPEMA